MGDVMAFSDLNFIFLFLPIFTLIYVCVKPAFKNFFLLLGNIVFYVYGVIHQPWQILLFLILLLVSYLSSHGIQRFHRYKKIILIGDILILFESLAYYKYFNTLPLAMSFYVFQMVAYVVDVYRGEIPVDENFGRYVLTMTLFFKFISGPLVSHKQMSKQVRHRHYYFSYIDLGLREFILGLSLKVLIANRVGRVWTKITNTGFESISSPVAWLGLLVFGLQLYFDFYGYSLMAKGVAKMLGFYLPDNFNHPYISRSVSEFYRRWHMTLGQWFKKYIYFPMGGNRCSKKRLVLNLAVVWAFTGIWHGSSFNYVLWGLFIGLFVILEKLYLHSFLEKHRIFSHVYVIVIILISWLFFAVSDMSKVVIYFQQLFSLSDWLAFTSLDIMRYLKDYGLLILAGIILATPLPYKIWDQYQRTLVGTLVIFALFWFCVYYLSLGFNDPFMYFGF